MLKRLLATLLIAGLIGATAAGAYIVAPFWTAWSIREAVVNSDTAFLRQKVEWPSVRETMRQSMLRVALDLPDPDAAQTLPAGMTPRPGLWSRVKQRVKTYYGRRVVDRMVDTYISAEGFPQLYRQRQTLKGMADPGAADPAGMSERFWRVWSRIRRAEFTSATGFEIEMQDQFEPERSYHARLELKGSGWVMTKLSIRDLTEALPVASAGP